jgi:hypothetical protein
MDNLRGNLMHHKKGCASIATGHWRVNSSLSIPLGLSTPSSSFQTRSQA